MTDGVTPTNLESDGVYLDETEAGCVLEVRTQNHLYRIVNYGNGEALVCGHPEYCPAPAAATIVGSTGGGSMFTMGFIGVGMRLKFRLPKDRVLVTSKVQGIRRC